MNLEQQKRSRTDLDLTVSFHPFRFYNIRDELIVNEAKLEMRMLINEGFSICLLVG